MMSKIDISIVVPFYKGNAYMAQLFSCIEKNTFVAKNLNVELIIVNDSPECEIVYKAEWVNGFELIVVENESNIGIQASRIRGLSEAKGRFVIFLDQDDILEDNALKTQYNCIRTADLVVANGYNENRDSKQPIYSSLACQNEVKNLRFYLSVGCMIVSPGQVMIRKNSIPELWKKKKICQNGADDYFLWLLLLLEKKCEWAINPNTIYIHIDTGVNLSSNLDKMLMSSREVLKILYEAGLLSKEKMEIAENRFQMRKKYEGRGSWRKLLAMLRYPKYTYELLCLTYLRKICK